MFTEMTCRRCSGSGWIVSERDGIEVADPCPACRVKERVARLLGSAAIPPRYFDKSLDNFEPRDKKTLAIAAKRAVEYIEAFPDVARGLLLVGPCGVGKTHLSVAILKSLIEEKLVRGRFVDEAELLRSLQYTYGPDSTNTEEKLLRPLMQADLLVWDDLGAGRATEWARETIGMVLNNRYTFNKQTILSTNRSLESTDTVRTSAPAGRSEQSLQERIGARLFSRILEMCDILTLDGPDCRIEIHKTGKVALAGSQSRRKTAGDPQALLRCPACKGPSVEALDKREKHSHQELACRCEKCGEQFVARFWPKTARIEYVDLAGK